MDQALGHLKLQASCRMQGLATSHPWSLNISQLFGFIGFSASRGAVSKEYAPFFWLENLASAQVTTLSPEYCPKMVYDLYNHDLQQLRFTLHIELPLQPVHHISALHLHFISKRIILRPPCAATTDCPEARQVIGSAASEKEDRLPLPRRSWHGSEIYPPKIRGQTPGMVWTCLEHPGTILNPNFGHFNILQCTE